MWDKPSSACGWSGVFFLGDLPFVLHLSIDLAQDESNNFDGRKTQIKKKKVTSFRQ